MASKRKLILFISFLTVKYLFRVRFSVKMDIRYFESLICVAEQGSIARAAKAQHLTAAAVGQRISILEEHFKVALLDRSSRSARPTEACTKLIPYARKIVSGFHEMGAILEPTGLSGSFTLGAIPTALTGILPNAVRRLAEMAPNLVLEIKPGTSESVFNDLSERKLDAALIALPPFELPGRISAEIVRKEPLVLLSRKGTGKTRRNKLENNPYICFDSKSWAGGGAVLYLKDENIKIEPFYELDALEPIEKLVQEGLGVSLVPHWSGLSLEADDIEHDIIRNDRYSRKIALLTPKDTTRPQAIKVLRECLHS